MVVPIIAGSDKTTVSVAKGHQEYHHVYMSPGNLTKHSLPCSWQCFPPSRVPSYTKRYYLIHHLTHWQIQLNWILSHSKQEGTREGTLPKILPTIILCLSSSYFCTPQGRNDNSRGCQMSGWPLLLCCVWYWTIYSQLSRAGLVGSRGSGLVPKVYSWILSDSTPNNQPGLRCDMHPNNLDAEGARQRSHQKTEFLIICFNTGALWDDFRLRSDVVVCLPIYLWT